MNVRKARVKDATQIHSLINNAAQKGNVLPRALSYIYENIRDFWVAEENDKLVGCVALHIIWEDLAEIKSLVVTGDFQKRGIGTELVEKVLEEAALYEIKKIFLLTYIPEYFLKFGFRPLDKSQLPHKIWAECINCPRFPDCNEEAMIKELVNIKD